MLMKKRPSSALPSRFRRSLAVEIKDDLSVPGRLEEIELVLGLREHALKAGVESTPRGAEGFASSSRRTTVEELVSKK